jgi:hypothetical protein
VLGEPLEVSRIVRPMNPQTRVKLRFGAYRAPRFRHGDVVFCERAGEVTLCGLSKGRIPWPTCRRGRASAIVLCGDLVKAVRRESSVAVQYWWGVGRDTVRKWRNALEVGRLTKGTRALMSDYATEPRMDAIRAKAWQGRRPRTPRQDLRCPERKAPTAPRPGSRPQSEHRPPSQQGNSPEDE